MPAEGVLDAKRSAVEPIPPHAQTTAIGRRPVPQRFVRVEIHEHL